MQRLSFTNNIFGGIIFKSTLPYKTFPTFFKDSSSVASIFSTWFDSCIETFGAARRLPPSSTSSSRSYVQQSVGQWVRGSVKRFAGVNQ